VINHCLVVAVILATAYGGQCVAQTTPDSHLDQGNPIDFNLANIKRGKQFYTLHCLSCHGPDGRGDTEMREFLQTPPADLSDATWIYSDRGEVVFDVIHQGRTERDMPAFEDKLNEQRIWQTINYLRYLGGERP